MQFNRCLHCMAEIQSYPCPSCGYGPSSVKGSDYSLRPGTILKGKYVVGTILGQGGFGITYVGWDLALDCKVAIKEYYPSGQVVRDNTSGSVLRWLSTPQSEAARDMGREMFLKEARKMTRVRDIPQVVHIHDLFQENDTAYIVMDFVAGQTLKAHLSKTGPLTWDRAQAIFFPVIRAMDRVHEAGLVHRDLSPDNLMLLPNGDVQILDLGAAKDLNVNSGASSMQVAKGGFSPLEQYSQRGSSGPWTDVYALAATMYYSLTGVLPPNAVDRVDEDPIRWDLPQLANLPKGVLPAIQQAMAVSAKARTQSMGEFLRHIEQSCGTAARTRTSKPAKKKKHGKTPLLIALLTLVLVALAGTWALLPREQPSEVSVPETMAPYYGTPAPTEAAIITEPQSEPKYTPNEDDISLLVPSDFLYLDDSSDSVSIDDLYTWLGDFTELYPHITINAESIYSPDYLGDLWSRSKNGECPDIAWIPSVEIESYVKAGICVDISKYMPDERFSAYSQDTLAPMAQDGTVYGLALPYSEIYRSNGLLALGDSSATQEHLENALLLMDYICEMVYTCQGIEY